MFGDPCNPECLDCDDGDPCTADEKVCDDGDPCTEDYCDGGVCFNDPLCPVGETCCPGTVAGGGACLPLSCSFTIDPASACAGSSVTMTLEGWCDPECESINFETVKSHPYLTVTSLGGSTHCDDSSFTREFNVNVSPDAPSGTHYFELVGTVADSYTCSALGQITVLSLMLTETPESYLPTNGNSVAFTASIVPAVESDIIRFELFDVSTFPGDAMNHGTQPDTDPDYQFEVAGNPGFTITSNQMVATTDTPVSSATVTVSAYDYGARGNIRARLVNLGCESSEREIPKDSDGDWLPDAYENMYPNLDPNNPDTSGDGILDGQADDDPERPVVADAGPISHDNARSALGLTGDGLTAFEEYRGFIVQGTHVRLSPLVKNVFVGIHDPQSPGDPALMPPGIGVGFLANLTGFQVHEIDVTSTTAPEWDGPATRYINFNRAGIPGATPQRAIRVIVNNNLGGLGLAHPITGGVFNQSPNEMDRVEVNVLDHAPGMEGRSAGPDGVLCTSDDVDVFLTAAQADDALRQTVGHECGHALHIEHTWCFGDRQVIPFGQGAPHTIAVHTDADGICDTAAAPGDIQLIPVGQRLADSVVIEGGSDGIDPQTVLMGDDHIVGNQVLSGPAGIAQTTAVGNDHQVLQPGEWVVNAPCVGTGENGISETVAGPTDFQQIDVDDGEPNQICVDDNGNGTLTSSQGGDDSIVGLTITTGANGICETWADAQIIGFPSVMTSDVLIPVPNTYTTDDLDQVRVHQKHP